MDKVFIFADYYLPGYKAGGPVQSIANMVDRLGDQFDFRIITRDRDVKDTTAYEGVEVNAWNQVGKARVYYVSPDSLTLHTIQKLTRDVSPQVIYLNSFFSPLTIKILALRRLGAVPKVPVILASRGEFSPGALELKAAKKRLYLALVLRVRLYRDLIWQVSSLREKEEVQKVIGFNVEAHVAPNLPPRLNYQSASSIKKPDKITGQVRLAFLSRISPKKNLHQALEFLRNLSGQVVLDIFGPLEDINYFRRCENIISSLPSNIKVALRSSVPQAEVVATLSQYHFFLLPTLGENFGHIILEALVAGCPVLISDRTPWKNLSARQAGWDLPLETPDRWHNVLQQCVDMNGATYQTLSNAARQFALDWISSPRLEDETVTLLQRALGSLECAASSAS